MEHEKMSQIESKKKKKFKIILHLSHWIQLIYTYMYRYLYAKPIKYCVSGKNIINRIQS